MRQTSKEKPRNIHAGHRQRKKKSLIKSDLENFSDIEKLEVLLYYTLPFKDTNPIAHSLLDEFKTFNNVINARYEDLLKVDGVGEHTATFFKLLNDTIRVYYTNQVARNHITEIKDICEFFQSLYIGIRFEIVHVIALSDMNEIMHYTSFTNHDPSKVEINFGPIISYAVNNNCSKVVVCHNHPNGIAAPSDDDLGFTSKLMSALSICNVDLVDHIIVSPSSVYSMSAAGQIKDIKRNLVNNKIIKHIATDNDKAYQIDNKYGKTENL